MELNGIKGENMLHFCGQDKALIDANGRIKLSPRVLNDFEKNGGFEIVLHCLPEGAIVVYPEAVYLQMRENEMTSAEKAATSVVHRRNLRRAGALSQSEKISSQGRITIPLNFRDFSNIKPGTEVMIVGCEIGVEIWNIDHWGEELTRINEHMNEKASREMAKDLLQENSKTVF